MMDHAQPTLPSAALLRKEQSAMADFLVALSDFDRRRGWKALGHASLFGFLVSEFGLSTSSTYWRKSAAGLLQRFPELARHLRLGRLCLTTMAELAKVLTEENKEPALPFRSPSLTLPAASPVTTREPEEQLQPQGLVVDTYSESLQAPEMKMTHPARVAPKPDEVVKKLETARRGRALRLDAPARARPRRALGQVGRLDGGQPAPHLRHSIDDRSRPTSTSEDAGVRELETLLVS
jgi:hypothetical protein